MVSLVSRILISKRCIALDNWFINLQGPCDLYADPEMKDFLELLDLITHCSALLHEL